MVRRDEFFHEPGPEEHWSESHYFHFVDEDVQGHGRIGFYPNRGQANVWAYVVAGESIYWVDDEVVPPEEVHGLRANRAAYTYGHHLETVGEEWGIEWHGTAQHATAPADVLAGRGETAEVDLQLTLSDRHDLFYYSDGTAGSPHRGEDDRYEVTCDVAGTVELDGQTHEVDCPGQRDHSWAPRQWAGDAEWLYASGAFEDGTAYHKTTAWMTGEPSEPVYENGYWYDGEGITPLTDVGLSADPQFSQATAEAWAEGDPPTFELDLAWADGSTTIDVSPIATTPLEFVNESTGQRALFNRSAYENTKADGTTGGGWLENPTQFQLD